MSERDVVTALIEERRAAEALRETLGKLGEMDEDTIRDTIEGETNLQEAIAGAVALLTNAEIMQGGLKAKLAELDARKVRYDNRVTFIRTAIEQAMVIGNLPSMELPDATLSLSKRAPGLVITDEAKIPARFWKPQDPVIDKKAIAEALKAKEEVAGASLGAGTVSLTIRRA